MNYKALLILTALTCAGGIYAQEEQLSFTLKEAQNYAMQHNKTLMNANQDKLLAQAQLREAMGAGLPQVTGSFDYMTNFNYEAELDFGGGGDVQPIVHPSFDEGDMVLAAILTQMAQGSGPTVIVMQDQANANLQVSQLLFSGQYIVGLQMAKIGQKLAESNFTMTGLDVKENVTSTYYLVLITREMLRIIDANSVNLEEVLKHTQDMFTVGMAEQTDVDQIRITVSQLENSRKSMERNLQLNLNMFRFVLGIDKDKEIVLTDSLSSLMGEPQELQAIPAGFDLSLNPSYQLMEYQEQLMKKSVSLNEWSYAPTVAGFYSYREKIMTTSFDLSPKHAAGISVNVPIFSGGTKRAQISQAKIELDKTSRSKSMVEEQLGLQEKQLNYELNSAMENYTTQKDNVEVAKRVYTSVHNKYKQGMVSSMDLTLANNNYLMAENNYVSATLNVLQARMKLDKLYNKL